MIAGPVGYSTIAATAAVFSKPGVIYGAALTGGSDAATVILYDNTAGSGSVILKLAAAAGVSVSVSIPNGVAVGLGCYATIAGTAPSVTVFGG